MSTTLSDTTDLGTYSDEDLRLLGHWGTSPGLSMIYALLNRSIRRTDSDRVYIRENLMDMPEVAGRTWMG